MLSYLLITYLLSGIGWLLYKLFVKHQVAPKWQKASLVGIIVLSLSLPFAIDNSIDTVSAETTTPTNPPTVTHTHHKLPETAFIEYCPEEEELDLCYEIAIHEEHFCNCVPVVRENILQYKEKPGYDIILTYREKAKKGAAAIAGFILLLLSFKIAYLLYLVVTSRKEKLVLQQQTFTILYPSKKLSVGSFQLWQQYIIWQKEMEQLDEAEKKAILWHEISHLHQKDTFLKIGLHLIQMLWALNPIYYLLHREFESLSEFIADEYAVVQTGNAKLYATLLVKMKRYQKLALANHFKTHQLKTRVEYLIQRKKRSQKTPRLVLFSLLVAASLSLTTYFAVPYINDQIDKVEVYQTLSQEKQTSGRSLFCKNCLMENL